MAKLWDKSVKAWMYIVGTLLTLGLGGLFINGTFTSVVLLKLLPLIVHKIVGWTIVVTTILGILVALIKKLSKM